MALFDDEDLTPDEVAVELGISSSEIFDLIMPKAESSIDGSSDNMLEQLLSEIADMRIQGLSDEVINERLNTNWEEGVSLGTGFGAVASIVEDEMSAVQREFYQPTERRILQEESGDDPLLIWWALGSNTCKDCVRRHGAVKRLSEWQRLGLPGGGSTICRSRCQCTLMPTSKAQKLLGTDATGENLTKVAREGIEERLKQLDKMQKERGKDYASSTFAQKLGQWRRNV